MLIVETIGRIRRAHLWSGKSIKKIARDLKISRNTVRRILRSGETSFSLRARDSAAPETRSLEGRDRSNADEKRGGVGARACDADPVVRGTAGARLRGRLRRRATLRQNLEPRTRQPDGERLRSVVVCAGRSLPVRLEPRDRGDGRRDDDFEGRACSPLP